MADLRISIKLIKPASFKSAKGIKINAKTASDVEDRIKKALKRTSKDFLKPKFADVFSTWGETYNHATDIEEDGPTVTGDKATMDVYSIDQVFWWLDNGVPRNARMSSDFVSKTKATKPATYKSGGGSGNRTPLYISPAGQPIGNIEPRNWTQQMADDATDVLRQNVIDELGK